jgi:hypothetical protein
LDDTDTFCYISSKRFVRNQFQSITKEKGPIYPTYRVNKRYANNFHIVLVYTVYVESL